MSQVDPDSYMNHVNSALALLARAELKGREVHAYLQVEKLLEDIRDKRAFIVYPPEPEQADSDPQEGEVMEREDSPDAAEA